MPTRLLSLLLSCAVASVAFAFVAEPGHTPTQPPVLELPEFHTKSARYALRRPKPSLGQRAARIALQAVGVPYRWGGASPASGFDCSGLIFWAYGRLGIEVPHSSYALYDRGRRVPRSRMKAGDLLFFSGLGHVGLYLGRGRMVHAPRSGRLVEVVDLDRSNYGLRLVGARRISA